jgi:hypothetical protein
MERHPTKTARQVSLTQSAGKRIDEEARAFECGIFVFTHNMELRSSILISSTGSAGKIFESIVGGGRAAALAHAHVVGSLSFFVRKLVPTQLDRAIALRKSQRTTAK